MTGAGRGIGRRAASALAAAGARVVLCARTAGEINEAAVEIRERTSAEALAVVADLADVSSVRRLAEVVRTRWGGLDIVVNNAATLGPVAELVDADIEKWIATLSANVGGVATVSHFMIPFMRRGGSIVNLSGGGIGGNAIQANVSAYTASKAATAILTETLADECAPRGIRVNAITPGGVATRLTEAIIEAGPDRAGRRTYDDAVRQREAPDHLDAFLELLVWVVSDRASWLTGRVLSARWNNIRQLEQMRPSLGDPSLLRLRRIDGLLFAPIDLG